MDPVQVSSAAPAPATPATVTPDLTAAGAVPQADPTQVSAPTGAPAPATAGTGTPAASSAEPKVLTIPSSAMKNLKAEERERGRTDALRALDVEAQGLGFANHAEMKAFVQQTRAGAPPAAPVPAQPAKPAAEPAQDPSSLASQKERELTVARDKALDEKKRLNRANAKTERENRQLKQQLIEQEVSTELKLAAKDAGVVDVDYAVEVLKRSIKGMSEAELQGFDEGKFFREQLRQSHPHLYQVEQRPVTTGTGNAPTAKPGAPSKTVDPNAASSKVDAKAMSPQDFQALLRKRGLSDPATGGMLA